MRDGARLPSLRPSLSATDTVFACPDCGKGLDIVYDYELAAGHFRDFPSSERPQNIWHFEELLPILDAGAQARVGQHSGYTPLIRADRLGAELGLNNLYLKDDSSNRPSLSYKDRVVSMSVARLLERGKTEIGCVSTGNVGTAVASMAAKAGVDAFIFYPDRARGHEGARVHGARREGRAGRGQLRRSQPPLPRSRRGDGHGLREHHAAPVLRRGREDRGVRDRRAAAVGLARPHRRPAAGGTLSSRMHKGLGELQLLGLAETEATQIHIAQPSGCNPIASAILAEEAEVHPVMPETAAHSLAIGAPGDGYLVIDAVHKRGGTAAFASDPEIFAGIDLLAATEGLLTEPAGGTTIAVLEKLAAAGRFAPDDTVVALITGNGLKTLDEHPPKEWPAKIDCELEPMLEALGELKRTPTLMQTAHEQLRA